MLLFVSDACLTYRNRQKVRPRNEFSAERYILDFKIFLNMGYTNQRYCGGIFDSGYQ